MGRTVSLALAVVLAGCSAPSTEPDFSPFIDVWTADPPPRAGMPIDYLILQGDFSVCQFTVRGPQDATYSGGEYAITPTQLTLTFKRDGATRTQVYGIDSYRPGELHLIDAAPGAGAKRLVLKHSRAYSSCADAQTLFGKLLKIR
jgi:hypothetical protein